MTVVHRALLCFILSFLTSFILTSVLIPRLRAMKMGQRILQIGPVWHAKKEGTPTMGGIAFLITVLPFGLLASFLFPLSSQGRTAMIATLLFCVANGAIGITDDLTKLRHKRNEGLTPTQKLILQTVISGAYLAILRIFGILPAELSLPFFGSLPLGIFTYFILLIYLIGITNCANLTDGIDGLAAGVGSVIFAFLFILSLAVEVEGGAIISALLLGCTVSFLFFNRHPARIFMGDTGSLFLGSAAGAVPIMLERPLLGIIFGIIYVLEGSSVVLQVLFYKKTKRRLFLMAPIHHHFEKCGWSENRIVLVFSAITAAASLLAFFLA
jgi:phospho-N-acetylmuramoyl-pentapeptide-transferase